MQNKLTDTLGKKKRKHFRSPGDTQNALKFAPSDYIIQMFSVAIQYNLNIHVL